MEKDMVLTVILAIVVIFAAVVLVRAAMFNPKPEEKHEIKAVEFDTDGAVDALARLVKCRTVSNIDPALEDDAEFEKLISILPELYPEVYKTCTLQRFDGRALLFKWSGREAGDPAVLMAHYDVVPVEEENWSVPAFDALIKDGVMWGRGTLDTKVTFNGILYAANTLIAQGYTPEHDIYMAFSGGEEVNGPGAGEIVKYFSENGITPSMVVDEGGAVVEDVFPGLKERCALIGIAEKGLLNVEYELRSEGGHASAPGAHTPVGRLAMACARVEAHPFKMHMTKPVAEMFDTLGRRSSFVYKIIFANMWCFGWILGAISKRSGGEINALLRTTVAFTQMSGSSARNVIPPQASMVSNIRLNPEDSIASAVEYLKKTIKDDDISVKVLEGDEPSPISRTDCEGWRKVANAVSDTWKGAVVSPYIMMQCSDSRRYGDISDKVYRFSAMDLTAEERHTIHGNNERIRLETVRSAVEFFIRLISQC